MQAKNIIASVLTKKIKMVILIFLAIIVGVMAKVFSALIIRNIIDRVILESGPLLFWTTMFFIAVLLSVGLTFTSRMHRLRSAPKSATPPVVYSAAIRGISELKIDTDEIVKGSLIMTRLETNISRTLARVIQMSLFCYRVHLDDRHDPAWLLTRYAAFGIRSSRRRTNSRQGTKRPWQAGRTVLDGPRGFREGQKHQVEMASFARKTSSNGKAKASLNSIATSARSRKRSTSRFTTCSSASHLRSFLPWAGISPLAIKNRERSWRSSSLPRTSTRLSSGFCR